MHELNVELFSKGDVIMKEGAVGTNMIFLLHGSVNVICSGDAIATLGDGALFGEMACLGLISKRTCSVVADDFCDCRCISSWHFQRLLDSFPEAKSHFARIATERQSVLTQVHHTHEVEAWVDRARRRRAKHRTGLLSDTKQEALLVLHEKRLMATWGGKGKRCCAIEADSNEVHAHQASLFVAGWELGVEDVQVEQEVDNVEHVEKQCLTTTEEDLTCHKPSPPVIPSPPRPGASFRKERLLKQEAIAWSSASTTASSSRSASTDFIHTHPSTDVLFLPILPESSAGKHASPKTLKAAMQATNAILLKQVLQAREDLVQSCLATKFHGIDFSMSGVEVPAVLSPH